MHDPELVLLLHAVQDVASGVFWTKEGKATGPSLIPMFQSLPWKQAYF